jgi:hypothetical protein
LVLLYPATLSNARSYFIVFVFQSSLVLIITYGAVNYSEFCLFVILFLCRVNSCCYDLLM